MDYTKIHEKWYNSVIDLTSMNELPTRRKFIDRPLDKQIVRAQNEGENFMFLPCTTYEMTLWYEGVEKYVLVLFGISESGNKQIVVIEEIKPFFVIRIPENRKHEPETYREYISAKISEDKFRKPCRTKIHMARRYIGYEEDEYPYVLLEFNTLKARRAAFYYVTKELNLDTGWDDPRDYPRVVSRNHNLSLTQWLEVEKYTIEDDPHFKLPIIKVTVDTIKTYKGKLNRPSLMKDKTLMAYWDIETYAKDHSVPQFHDKNAKMFQISLVFCWLHQNEPIMQYMITCKPSKPQHNFTTILCKDEGEMISAMGKILELMMPDFMVGFNCGGYDFPWIIDRAKKTGTLVELHELASMVNRKKTTQDDVLKWNYFTENVKIEAETSAIENTYRFPGALTFDLCTMFRQLHPNDGYWSLEYFLSKCGLPPKDDIKPRQIFLAFEAIESIQKHPLFKQVLKYGKQFKTEKEKYSNSILLEQFEDDDEKEIEYDKSITVEELYKQYDEARNVLSDVAKYCIIDSYRCHQLLKLRDIVGSKRTMAHISYTSMFDAVYRAGGAKSRNGIAKVAYDRNVVTSLAKKNVKTDLKYPGAFVFNPKPGFRTTRLTPFERREKYRNFQRDKANHPTRYENCTIPERVSAPYSNWKNITDEQINELNRYIYENDIDCVKMSKSAATELVKSLKVELTKNQEDAFIEYLMEDTDYPVTGLDFASLYPSVDMTYNLSGETIISPDEYGSVENARRVVMKLKSKGYNIHRIEFSYGAGTVISWCIRHDNDPKKIGIFPSVYAELFALRAKFKAPLKLYEMLKEYCKYFKMKQLSLFEIMLVLRLGTYKKGKPLTSVRNLLEVLELYPEEKDITDVEKRIDEFKIDQKEYVSFLGLEKHKEFIPNYVRPEIPKLKGEMIITIPEIEFYAGHFETKQLQIKIYMNTFYGESGNQASPLYKKDIAGGITTGGVHNIKFAAKVVESQGCGIVYGDTDSLYIHANPSLFREINKLYFTGKISKLEYWTKLVAMTSNEIDRVQIIVNNSLVENNGSNYLKMEYEEVLWPYFLSRKKKYGGVQHKAVIKFDITELKKLFLRGLDVRKRGTSVLTVRATENILFTAIRPDNLLTWRELTLNEIDRIYEDFKAGKLDITQFIKTAKYKPITIIQRAKGKGNKSVLTFADRMKARGTQLTPHTRFNFVIAEGQQFKYDYRGRKRILTTGERMETVEYVKDNNISVDINYYMLNYICGQLCQFVSYHPDFYVAPRNDSHEEAKKSSDTTNKAAKKFLTTYCKRYMTPVINRGPLVRILFKYTKSKFEEIFQQLGCANWTPILFVDWQVGTSAKFRKSFVSLVEKNTPNDDEDDPDDIIKRKIKKYGKDYIFVLYRDYVTSKKSKQKQAELKYREQREKYIGLLAAKINTIMSTIHKHMALVEKANMDMRKLGKIGSYFQSATKDNPKVKSVEELLGKWMTDMEVEETLAEFDKQLYSQLKEFTGDDYYQRGFETLELVYNKMIKANQKLIQANEMAKAITKKVNKVNKKDHCDDDELEEMRRKVNEMSDVDSSDSEKAHKLKKGADVPKAVIDDDSEEDDDESAYDSDGDTRMLILDDEDIEERALPIEDD